MVCQRNKFKGTFRTKTKKIRRIGLPANKLFERFLFRAKPKNILCKKYERNPLKDAISMVISHKHIHIVVYNINLEYEYIQIYV